MVDMLFSIEDFRLPLSRKILFEVLYPLCPTLIKIFTVEGKPILDNRLALWSQYTFRMELNTMDIIMLVLQTHDATVITHSCHIKTLWEICSIHYP